MTKPHVDPRQSIAHAITAGHEPMARAIQRLKDGGASGHKDGARAGLKQQQQTIDYAHGELSHHVQTASAALPADHPAQRELTAAVQAGEEVRRTADHYCDDDAARRLGAHLQIAQQLVAADPPQAEQPSLHTQTKELRHARKQYRKVQKMAAAEQREQQNLANWNRWLASVKRRRI